jgi:hypothetical protein
MKKVVSMILLPTVSSLATIVTPCVMANLITLIRGLNHALNTLVNQVKEIQIDLNLIHRIQVNEIPSVDFKPFSMS